jgi:arginine/lysine/ornithine decarboxylase
MDPGLGCHGDRVRLGLTDLLCHGRVSAKMFCPYPRRIPVVAPGKLLNGAIVDYLARH